MPEEREQGRVDLSRGSSTSRAGGRVDLQRGAPEPASPTACRGADRHDLVVVACRIRSARDPLEVLGEIRLGEGLDAVEHALEAGPHPLEPERVAQARRDLGARPVGPVERPGQVLEKLGAVREDAGADLIEGLHRQAARVGDGLQHDRRHRADQHRPGHALRAVAAQVAGDLAAAGGVADMDRALEIERVRQRREIVGVGVHLVAAPGLARPPWPGVVGDAAVAARAQKQHLVFPGVRAQRPAVAEDHRRAAPPVLVVDLGAVLRGDGAHAPEDQPKPTLRQAERRSPSRRPHPVAPSRPNAMPPRWPLTCT